MPYGIDGIPASGALDSGSDLCWVCLERVICNFGPGGVREYDDLPARDESTCLTRVYGRGSLGEPSPCVIGQAQQQGRFHRVSRG
jgi:hypothetical protein